MRKLKKTQDKASVAKKLLIVGIILVASLLLSLTNPQNILRQNAVPTPDDAVFQSIAFHMSQGKMPYRDIFDHKGPLLYVINFIGFVINASWGIWLLELIAILITLLIIYKTARLFTSRFWSLVSTLLTATIAFSYIWNEATGVETFSLPFIACSLLHFLKFIKNGRLRTKEILLSGVNLGAVLMLRPNMIAVWVIFCIAVVIEFTSKKKFKELFTYIWKFATGITLVVAPLIIWLLFTKSFGAFIDCYFSFNSYYTLHSQASTLSNRIHLILKPFKNSLILLGSIGLLAVLIGKRDTRKTCIYVAITMMLSLFSIASSGRSYSHYYTVLIPCIAIPFSLTLGFLSEKIQKTALCLILILFSVYSIFPIWTEHAREIITMAKTARLDLNYEQYGNVIDYIKRNSSPDDKITTWRNSDSVIYIGSRRLSATKYSYVPEIIGVDENREKEFREQIIENKPKFAILPKNDSTTVSFTGFFESLGYSLADNFKDEHFNLYETTAPICFFETTKIGKVLEDGTLFDPDIYVEDDTFYLYVSARNESSIVRYESSDGTNWTNKRTVISLDAEPEGTIINRATVLKKDDLYYIYYSTQKDGKSYINVATGSDGVNFKKYGKNPIISPEKSFEGESTMNADVIFDEGKFKMWYATGETYEPNTISYAESKDGFDWKKRSHPIKHKDQSNPYSKDRVGGPEVLLLDNTYYLFYIGYSDINTGYIMLSSSAIGTSDFTDYKYPLVTSSLAGFDKDSVYKPTVHYRPEDDTLFIWYNGRNQSLETIGLVKVKNFKKTAAALGL